MCKSRVHGTQLEVDLLWLRPNGNYPTPPEGKEFEIDDEWRPCFAPKASVGIAKRLIGTRLANILGKRESRTI